MRILLVEDERAFAGILAAGLTAEGYAVDQAHDGRMGLLLAQTNIYGAIVLDLMLPLMSGFAVCRQLRQDGNSTPILVLTAKTGEFDQLEVLDSGADDFLSKPFSYPVLLARLRALTRRAPTLVEAVMSVGDLRIDSGRRLCWRGDQPIALSALEFGIVEFLARQQGRAVDKQELLIQLWPGETEDVNLVEARISALRQKVDHAFGRASIRTVRGSGYRLIDDRSI